MNDQIVRLELSRANNKSVADVLLRWVDAEGQELSFVYLKLPDYGKALLALEGGDIRVISEEGK